MVSIASDLIDALGGTTAVHKLTKAPTSTVHSWRKNGIPPARLDHLRLVAKEAGKLDEFDRIASGADDVVACGRYGERAEQPQIASCVSVHCPMRRQEAA